MSDLSHWDIATDFTGEQAAALAMGFDPAQPEYVRSPSNPIYERMKWHYNAAKRLYQEEDQQGDGPTLMDKSEVLESIDLQWCVTSEDPEDGVYFPRWLRDSKLSGFEIQRFTRKEIARWLSLVGVKSPYSFDVTQVDAKSNVEKPLGLTERNTLLTIIAALAKEAKINIDPPGKAAGYVSGLTDDLGAHVSKRAIENHFKKIKNALAARMK